MYLLREGTYLGLENRNVVLISIREKNVRDIVSFIRVIYMIGK